MDLPREGHANFQGLASLLQQPRRTPGLEALEKMRAFYIVKGIDILKDAVSLPDVSLRYLLRGAVERRADMWSPCKEAYDMLKGAVVGGPSIVFSRRHEVGVTKIRDHQYADARTCQKNVGLRRQRALPFYYG